MKRGAPDLSEVEWADGFRGSVCELLYRSMGNPVVLMNGLYVPLQGFEAWHRNEFQCFYQNMVVHPGSVAPPSPKVVTCSGSCIYY